MAFVGCLEDLRLAELLQILALFRKSGKLTLSRGDTTGVFLFNKGKIFHGANGYSAPSVGELLVDRKLITHEALDAAVATQRMAPKRKKLGTILVDMGATTYEALQRALSCGHTEACLHCFEPVVGDCVLVPAGTVHALGAGLLVAEIQQSSDTTFRLFDWNRVGPDGQPRPLHVAQALAAIDFQAGPIRPVASPPPADEPRAA